MTYVGIDLGRRYCYATILNENGDKIGERRFPAVRAALKNFALSISGSKAVLEAGSNCLFAYDVLEESDVDVRVANPLKVKAIACARIKNDKLDSATLAEMLRLNAIPESWIPKVETRDLRELVRYRAALVSMRTEVKNKISAILAKEWIAHDFSDLFGKKGVEFLKSVELRPTNREILNNYLRLLEFLSKEIEEINKRIEEIAKNNEQAMLLTSIPGISYYSALLIISEIGDIARFSNKCKLASYAGLAPRLHQSSAVVRKGHITKQGSKWLRWIMIQVAHVTVRCSPRMRDFYNRIKERRGEKIAIVASARELLNIIYHMLRNKEVYHE